MRLLSELYCMTGSNRSGNCELHLLLPLVCACTATVGGSHWQAAAAAAGTMGRGSLMVAMLSCLSKQQTTPA